MVHPFSHPASHSVQHLISVRTRCMQCKQDRHCFWR